MKKLSVALFVFGVAHAAFAQPVSPNTHYSPTNKLSVPPATHPLVVTPQERARAEERMTQDKAHVPVPRGMPGNNNNQPMTPAPGTPPGEAPPPPPGTHHGDAPPLPPGSSPNDPPPPHQAPRGSDGTPPPTTSETPRP